MMMFLSNNKEPFNSDWTPVYSVIEAKDFISEHAGEIKSLYVENKIDVVFNGELHECTPGSVLICWFAKRLKKKKKSFPACTFVCSEEIKSEILQFFQEENIEWNLKFKIENAN